LRVFEIRVLVRLMTGDRDVERGWVGPRSVATVKIV